MVLNSIGTSLRTITIWDLMLLSTQRPKAKWYMILEPKCLQARLSSSRENNPLRFWLSMSQVWMGSESILGTTRLRPRTPPTRLLVSVSRLSSRKTALSPLRTATWSNNGLKRPKCPNPKQPKSSKRNKKRNKAKHRHKPTPNPSNNNNSKSRRQRNKPAVQLSFKDMSLMATLSNNCKSILLMKARCSIMTGLF